MPHSTQARYRPIVAATLLLAACGHRVPQLPTGFWRLDGVTLAEQRLAKGDSGLIFAIFPDSTGLAFKRPINLTIDVAHEFYHLKWGDLGIDSLTLIRARDSIATFLDAYDVRILAAHMGMSLEQTRRELERASPTTGTDHQ
jgi:hypothetical protein